MVVIQNKGDATEPAVSCQRDGTIKLVVENDLCVNTITEAEFAQRDNDNAVTAKSREGERRKWMWQMGTIVVMGFSGLCLNAVIKPFATPRSATTQAADAYCQNDQQVASTSQEQPANSLERLCAKKHKIDQSARILSHE